MATSDKYDRQLRLWGAAGQRALAETCVILVRATASGTETLKNLVLPGVGAYCVVDQASAPVSPQDVSANFFTATAAGDATVHRAELACQQLQELNPDVQGSFLVVEELEGCLASLEAWETQVVSKLPNNSDNKKKLLVIASDLEPPLKLKLAQICEKQSCCLILVQTYGLMGTVRLQTPALPIIDPKPRDSPPDLRLTAPFPAFVEMAKSISWDTLDLKDHKHVPYPLVLYKVQQEYRAAHQGQLPRKFTEKQEFAQQIKAAAKDYNEQDNFQEATKNAYLGYAERTVDTDHIQSLLEGAQKAGTLPKFVVLLQALLEFLENHNGQAPLQGTIPDMTASTDLYVKLQSIYRDQSVQDVEEMKQLVTAKTTANPQNGNASVSVSEEELLTFCQNVHHLDLVSLRTLQEEVQGGSIPDEVTDDLVMALAEEEERPEMVPLLWHLGLKACDGFYQKHQRYPGTTMADDEYLKDVPVLQDHLKQIIERYGLNGTDAAAKFCSSTDASTELCRYGNAEIHNVAAIVGGVASQEAVKLITGQYTPLNNTYIYNGIASTGGVYKF